MGRDGGHYGPSGGVDSFRDVEKERKRALAQQKEAKRKSAEELTKRLQKLALDHQKENAHERLQVIQADQSSHLSSAKTFQELNLPKHLLDAIFEMGFERPSSAQHRSILYRRLRPAQRRAR